MVNKCCVPKCRGNYDKKCNVHVFKFPADSQQRRKWIHAIKRENFVPSEHSVVCELHFQSWEIEKISVFYCDDGQKITLPLKHPRLSPGAVPSVLPNCPNYLSRPSTSYRESPEEKKLRLENEYLLAAIDESAKENIARINEISFSTFDEQKSKLNLLILDEYWSIIKKEDRVLFVHIDYNSAPKIVNSVVVDKELKLGVHYCGKKVFKLGGTAIINSVSNVNEINDVLEKVRLMLCFDTSSSSSNSSSSSSSSNSPHDILDLVSDLLLQIDTKNSEFEKPVTFMLEKIKLLTKKRSAYQHSSWFLILSCMLFTISPHSYKYLKHLGFLIFPHPSTIRRLCSSFGLGPQMEQSANNFLKYTRNKYFGKLSENDKLVTLMMDEIHLKSLMDFKAGNFVGTACNNQLLASSAHTFMISSLLSDLKEVVHIVPVNKMCAEDLQSILKKIILGLEQIGFNVLCVISDNSSINRRCMQLFSPEEELKCMYNHPVEKSKPLFFLFDSVHLLKCLRNNWINQKNEYSCMYYPDFANEDGDAHDIVGTASFAALRQLYDIEEKKMVKHAYALTLKALYPSSLERQNVSLALQVFNENVALGFESIGASHNIPHFLETSNYIQIILKWWWIVNVKTPRKGRRLNNLFMNPLSPQNQESWQYLSKFLRWLHRWKDMHLSGSLTSETMNALTLTTEGIIYLYEYCTSRFKFKYFLPGKFQTDLLECRFGYYRQLAGGQHNISLRQMYEIEQKLRTQSTVSVKLESKIFGTVEINDFMETDLPLCESDEEENPFTSLEISENDILSCNEDFPVLVYISGYCCHSVLKKIKCIFCKEIIVFGGIS
ncbi:hypothetical protein R5R35_001482 [Gryllus longicercus]|uniref:THAP-type domain-containing protein n=1 Tax=Gryllus longicercus TaxID=2509291 RepID=A0AAN9Z505_9ORTH